jgi:CheY-like chemotaxis protein
MNKKSVLVIDDDPSVIQILSNILRPHYRVQAATRGIQGVAIAASPPPPDLILLDVLMPGLDGYEICAELQALPETRNIPVGFVTGNASPDEMQRGRELGGKFYLTKPLNPEEVLSRVQALIG